MSSDSTGADRADQNQGFLSDRVGSDRIGSDRDWTYTHTALAPVNSENVPINRESYSVIMWIVASGSIGF